METSMTTGTAAKKLSAKERARVKDRDEAIESLRDLGVVPGRRLYTDVARVSSSGMSRVIKVLMIDKRGDEPFIRNISGYVARAIGCKLDQDTFGVKISGCGMDMGFHIVYSLGRVMFPNGGELKDSNVIRQAQEAAKGRETDGGYLLKHEWI